MSDLSEISQDIATYLDFHLSGAENGQSPSGIGTDADAAITHYHAMGICELLMDAEVDAFMHHLIRGAQLRKWLLDRSRAAKGFPESVIRASNARGIFGAIAAFQWPLAREIAALSPAARFADVEYEDDFAYGHFLHRYGLSAPPAELADILARFEAALEGGPSARLALSRALVARDPEAGAEAFDALIEEQTAKLDDEKKLSVYATDGLWVPLSAIFVEGLAWLALLETAGIALGGEYPLCPSLARQKQYAPFEVTTFPSVPL